MSTQDFEELSERFKNGEEIDADYFKETNTLPTLRKFKHRLEIHFYGWAIVLNQNGSYNLKDTTEII